MASIIKRAMVDERHVAERTARRTVKPVPVVQVLLKRVPRQEKRDSHVSQSVTCGWSDCKSGQVVRDVWVPRQ